MTVKCGHLLCHNRILRYAEAKGMVTLKERIRKVQERVARACQRVGRSQEGVTIIAVGKGFSATVIGDALAAGLQDIGENRVSEAVDKYKALSHVPLQPRWHMVGHLQRNKIRSALRTFDIIHSVDSLSLAEAISSRAERIVPILVEVNVSGESNKFGFRPQELDSAVASIDGLSMVEVRGLMAVASQMTEMERVRPQFAQMRELANGLGLEELSMGMTDDFEMAIEEGATMVRIGRAIFGERT